MPCTNGRSGWAGWTGPSTEAVVPVLVLVDTAGWLLVLGSLPSCCASACMHAGARVIVVTLCAGAGVITVILCECVRADSCAVCRGGSKACNNS